MAIYTAAPYRGYRFHAAIISLTGTLDVRYEAISIVTSNGRFWPRAPIGEPEPNGRFRGGAAVHRREATDRTRPVAVRRTLEKRTFARSSFSALNGHCDQPTQG
jgi:hypothetical protein